MLYVPNQRIAAPTVIFAPVFEHYSREYRVTVDGGTVLSRADATHLLVANQSGASSVSVTIKPGA